MLICLWRFSKSWLLNRNRNHVQDVDASTFWTFRTFWARVPFVGYLEITMMPALDQQMSPLLCVWVLIGYNLYPTKKLLGWERLQNVQCESVNVKIISVGPLLEMINFYSHVRLSICFQCLDCIFLQSQRHFCILVFDPWLKWWRLDVKKRMVTHQMAGMMQNSLHQWEPFATMADCGVGLWIAQKVNFTSRQLGF